MAVVFREQANLLGQAWVDEAFTMRRELRGEKELPPRWRRCFNHVDEDLGELLGQSYVKARFAGAAKARAVELTQAVLATMHTELDQLPWMDDPTRAAAKQKLDKMAYLVGFPDKWKTYDFAIARGDFAGNVRAATHWELARQLAKIGKPVDRFDWGMTPPTVNAYYEPTLNELALPAGQLQPPFFGPAFHPAVNFGSTGGGTIGHEMTHGFDDEGSQFDANGNLREWWTKPTKDKFAQATRCVVDQYANYEAVPGLKLNGKLTAGENIADNGGVKLAYQAYQTWRAQQASPPPAQVDGYSDDQLYFMAYGQSWCDKATPEVLETRARSNPHSPPRWRVNGVIVNQPGFGPAFKCAAGAPMAPVKQCSVW
jgi:predicted metalloendopeptidase